VSAASTDDLARPLRAAGLRVTAPRLAVLATLHDRAHVDVETVRTAVHEQLGGVSTQAVYDVLKAFTAAGLVRRIEPAGSPALFETRIADNHHHIVCRGTVADIDCVTGAAPCPEPSSTPPGFAVDEAEVTFWGVCADCQSKNREGIDNP
jgi:Fur family transcriptional regulator, stress-responsive regulator